MLKPFKPLEPMSLKAFIEYTDDYLLNDQDFEPAKKTPEKSGKAARGLKTPIKPYKAKSPAKDNSLRRSPPRSGGKVLKEKKKSLNFDINHICLAPLESSRSPAISSCKSSSRSPTKATLTRSARNESQSASKEGCQSNQDFLSTTTASSSRRSRKERNEQK